MSGELLTVCQNFIHLNFMPYVSDFRHDYSPRGILFGGAQLDWNSILEWIYLLRVKRAFAPLRVETLNWEILGVMDDAWQLCLLTKISQVLRKAFLVFEILNILSHSSNLRIVEMRWWRIYWSPIDLRSLLFNRLKDLFFVRVLWELVFPLRWFLFHGPRWNLIFGRWLLNLNYFGKLLVQLKRCLLFRVILDLNSRGWLLHFVISQVLIIFVRNLWLWGVQSTSHMESVILSFEFDVNHSILFIFQRLYNFLRIVFFYFEFILILFGDIDSWLCVQLKVLGVNFIFVNSQIALSNDVGFRSCEFS